MVLGHGHRRLSLASSRSSAEEVRPEPAAGEDETVIDADQGNVLSHIISQLRPGADLSRVTLPTFILEPRSMLERITNFMAHPETLLPMPKIEDPVERFISVVKFYLSGWHIKPPGVKKPLNPILGEVFTCWWDYPDKTRGYYISEQTSHHPPKSSYFFMAPDHHIRIDGTLKPRSKFLGNSAASMTEGLAVMRFLNRGERYFITQPNMYARGILFGKMKYELGDHSFVRCPELGLVADIEFKTKGYFSGTYNAIGGFIRDMKTDQNLYELSGLWNAEMYIKDLATGKKQILFDATHAKETPPLVRPLSEQDERESQRLWKEVTAAIKRKDQDTATDHKSRIEDMQRMEASKRADEGVDWHPRLFRRVQGGPGGPEEGEEDLDWIINARVDGKTPAEQTRQILQIAAILPGHDPHRRFSIPSRKTSLETVPRATHHAHSKSPLDASKHVGEHSSSADGPSEDLIDFGQHDASASAAPPPKRQELFSRESYSGFGDPERQPTPQPAGLQAPLVPTPAAGAKAPPHERPDSRNSIMRQDSQSDELDEFVDAES
ncbi:putative oxysterol binding protein [Lineolata rhizophorae]|uniref:Putative oxysterol binding protein n=1 Tax=Lineolata rhizophorae TaxID=578093 RepID=A0A6A6P3G3_9PEZI|nr:putative oxysterol binding protein [Lineolata rhizophorae]